MWRDDFRHANIEAEVTELKEEKAFANELLAGVL
jgi:hypothetical protein